MFTLTSSAADEHRILARGTGADGYVRASDYYYVYRSRADFEKEAFAWDIRRKNGIVFDEVGEPELRRLEPDLSSAFCFAIRLPDHGFSIDPGQLVKGLTARFRKNGGRFLRAKVRSIETLGNVAAALITAPGAWRMTGR
nr:FAD-dependent oxidoreductase [Ruegeria arenilitoris]